MVGHFGNLVSSKIVFSLKPLLAKVFAIAKVASGKGEETEQSLDAIIDIGAFSADPDKLKDDKQVLLIEKHRLVSGENKLTITLAEKPSYVGVDPFVKLIDRDTKDNIFKL